MKTQGFFAIDCRAWAEICDLGLNEAIAYLVLAQGTGANNRMTCWSATALRIYTGITWERAQAAIRRLVVKGFIGLAPGHSEKKPRYDILPWADVFPAVLEQKRSKLTEKDKRLLVNLSTQAVQKDAEGKLKNELKRLRELGVIHQGKDGYSVHFPPVTPDPIWLPNSIVTGTGKGEESPLRRLRSCGEIWTLRLFVDLYHAQNLRDDGGISPQIVRETYSRKLVGQQGLFSIWAFKSELWKILWEGPFAPQLHRPAAVDDEDPVWGSIRQLMQLGLISFVPHLWDSDSRQGEILHPYGTIHGGEQIERKIGTAAYEAAFAMCLENSFYSAIDEGYEYFAPVKTTLPNVQMVGVLRLTYRPHTRRTASWFKELHENAPKWIECYAELSKKAEAASLKRLAHTQSN